MRILSWLRQTVADFFYAGDDEHEREAERAREELEELRSLALLAVAQARRTELELRDALRANHEDSARLADLVPRLEEERARAADLMARYRRRETEEEERLSRLGQLRLAEEINERRQDLRGAVDLASRASREEDLTAMEDEARAEAVRLDVLDRFDAGERFERETTGELGAEELRARARKLLESRSLQSNSEEL